MLEWIKDIQKQIPSMIILGGFARYIIGYESSYDKTWIDVNITDNSLLEPLKLSGKLIYYDKNDFHSAVKDRWIWKSSQGFVLDIFISDIERDYIIKDELNLITIQSSISFYQEYLLEIGENEYIKSKITKLQSYI